MAKDKQERLQKIITQIAKENLMISQAKQRLKSLNAQKKKLEQQIRDEESAQLMSVLADYGIRNIDDFEKFIDGNDIAAFEKTAKPTDE